MSNASTPLPDPTPAASIPPAERLALLEHADALDAWKVIHIAAKHQTLVTVAGQPLDPDSMRVPDFSTSQWKEVEALEEAWIRAHPCQGPALGVRHCWLMLGLEDKAPGGGKFVDDQPGEVLKQIRQGILELKAFAPHITQDPRLLPQQVEDEDSLRRGLQGWLHQVLGPETLRLDAWAKQPSVTSQRYLKIGGFQPPLEGEFQGHQRDNQAIRDARLHLKSIVGGHVPSDGTPPQTLELNDRTKSIIVNGETFDIQSPAAYAFVVEVIRCDGRKYNTPKGPRARNLLKMVPAEVKALLSPTKKGPGGGTALHPDWRGILKPQDK